MRGGVMARRVLVCAATKWEAGPLSRRLSAVVLRTGMGPQRARAALSAVPAEDHYDLAVSAGFAGALQPGIAPGDVVMDVREAPAEWPPLSREIAQRLGVRLHFGRIMHSDKVLAAPSAKRCLGEKERACAVDMETEAVRAWARERGAEALAVRVVLDAVDDELPAELPQGEDFPALARYALSRPASLPGLIRLGMRQRRAIAVLGDFLAALLESL